jgi:hypothetical protein
MSDPRVSDYRDRLAAFFEAFQERVAARRGSPLTEDEIGRVFDGLAERIADLEGEWGPRIAAATDDELPAIADAYFAAVVAPIARAGLDA